MKIGILVSNNDAETCWNAIRYALFALGQKDEVKMFFMGKGVEYQKVSTDEFNTIKHADKFIQAGGKIYACGTCMKSRQQVDSTTCPLSTMKDMYDIVKEADRVVSF